MKRQNGATLMIVLVILVMMTLLGITAMKTVTIELQISKNDETATQALMWAENGLAGARESLFADPMGIRDDLENDIDVSGTTTIGWGTFDYRIHSYGNATPTLKAAVITSTGTMSTGFTLTVNSWAKFLDSPITADAALTLYDSGNVTLKGDPEIDGHDHGVPNNFNCNGNGCQDTPAIPADDVTGIYSENDLANLNLIGTPTLDGNPAQQVGGGTNDAGYWEQYVIDAQGYTSAVNGSAWGTRDNPVVHVINQDMGIMGNTDGAGILIIKDAAVAFGGNFHFEGRIIILSTTGAGASITMGGTSRIFGSMVVVGPNTTIDFGSAGTPELMYSSEALGNIANTITWKVDGWFEERG